MTTVAATAPRKENLKSEDKLPNAIDKCIADGIIKTGAGAATGTALSLVLFRRRFWPITLGVGLGMGMALSNCQNNLND